MDKLSERIENKISELEPIRDAYRPKSIGRASYDQLIDLLSDSLEVSKRYEDAPVIQVESPCLRDCLGDAGYQAVGYPDVWLRLVREPARRDG